MIVHKQVLANLIKPMLTDFEDIKSLIKALQGKTTRELIMSLVSKKRDKLFIVIEYSW